MSQIDKHLNDGDVNTFRKSKNPLNENAEDHVPKNQSHENELRDRFGEEIEVIRKVEIVENLQHQTKNHLSHSNYNGELHFERIDKGCLVVTY